VKNEHRSTRIENNELELALSVLIGVYQWPYCFFQQERTKHPMSQQVFYRTLKVDGLSIFYREAGPRLRMRLRHSCGDLLGWYCVEGRGAEQEN
jgi:hypothetical protein